MKQRHMILRTSRLMTRNIFSGPSATEPAWPQSVDAEIVDLERRDIPSLTRDASVAAVAPIIPLKLFTPLDVREPSAVELEDVAWGVRAVRADTAPFDGAGAVVAVLDTGIDAAHPAFTGMSLECRNFTDEADADVHGHGTHCAATTFGRAVGATRIGVAPGVRRALIGKVLGGNGGSSEWVLSAIQWAAENGAHVISMSLGIDFPGYARALQQQGLPEELAVSRALEGYRANVLLFERLAHLLRARHQPVVVVAAAGNESRRDLDPSFEIAVPPPAVAEGIVSVAALQQGAKGLSVAPFSNTGADVAAPGVGIVSARLGGGLVAMSGTSMATSHVAGVAALWAQRLMQLNQISSLNLAAKVVGSGTLAGLRNGVDAFDVGAGLVPSPQS